MPELRHDDLTGARVLVAPGRAVRPDTFRAPETSHHDDHVDTCPFCSGNEHRTPPELARRGSGEADGPGWNIRVVPNLYPLVGSSVETNPGIAGAHEVIVLSPHHDQSLADLTPESVEEHFGLWQERCRQLVDAGFAHAAPFVNHGRAAGASIEHPHAQVVAIDHEPPEVIHQLDRIRQAGRDLVADQLVDAQGDDLVVASGPAPAWCPRTSASPYEMMVAHRSTRSRFDEATTAEVGVVARSCHAALRRLRAVLGDVPYNLVVHTAAATSDQGYHWHVRITPRLTVRAGFELGTGVLVNVVAPEAAADQLRRATA